MTYSGIRAGISTRLASIGLEAHGMMVTNPQPPCAMVRPTDHDYDLVMSDGGDMQRYDVLLFASQGQTAWDVAQSMVDGWLDRSGATSVKACFEADVTLSGTCHTSRITGWRDYGIVSYNGIEYFGVRFLLEVWPI